MCSVIMEGLVLTGMSAESIWQAFPGGPRL
jgi:hypothetical protein